MSTITPRRRALYQDPAAVRRHRILAGLTQTALADRAEITDAHVSKIENGKSSVSPAILARIANELGCPVVALLSPELQPTTSQDTRTAEQADG